IGAGAGTDGQVLVLQDMLGLHRGKVARFVKNFLKGQDSVDAALRAYGEAVRHGHFPSIEHGFE
ncbi:MAG: 3-methyl-2-oxobutanoate hydroxymethyltransferase, partial [Pseudomonadales bacterium]|nr:3-methyl-2-oxobutanoate hydroxymethyltransferase [Pseudomonadales bacterium]